MYGDAVGAGGRVGRGVGRRVKVAVGRIGVMVGMGVSVGVAVGVSVGVGVIVRVGVLVGVGVQVGGSRANAVGVGSGGLNGLIETWGLAKINPYAIHTNTTNTITASVAI